MTLPPPSPSCLSPPPPASPLPYPLSPPLSCLLPSLPRLPRPHSPLSPPPRPLLPLQVLAHLVRIPGAGVGKEALRKALGYWDAGLAHKAQGRATWYLASTNSKGADLPRLLVLTKAAVRRVQTPGEMLRLLRGLAQVHEEGGETLITPLCHSSHTPSHTPLVTLITHTCHSSHSSLSHLLGYASRTSMPPFSLIHLTPSWSLFPHIRATFPLHMHKFNRPISVKSAP